MCVQVQNALENYELDQTDSAYMAYREAAEALTRARANGTIVTADGERKVRRLKDRWEGSIRLAEKQPGLASEHRAAREHERQARRSETVGLWAA
jgi:hypothetical protein